MPKVSQQYRDARRAQILDAARRCFLRDGFHATSMQDLFAESRLSSGSVYRYFASKEDVVLAIAEENMRDVMSLVQEATTDSTTDSVGVVVAEVLRLLDARHAQHQLGGLAVLVWAEVMRNPTLAGQFRELLDELASEFADLITATRNPNGTARSRPPAESTAQLLVEIIAGHIMRLGVLGTDTTADAAEAVVVVLDHGLSRR